MIKSGCTGCGCLLFLLIGGLLFASFPGLPVFALVLAIGFGTGVLFALGTIKASTEQRSAPFASGRIPRRYWRR